MPDFAMKNGRHGSQPRVHSLRCAGQQHARLYGYALLEPGNQEMLFLVPSSVVQLPMPARNVDHRVFIFP
jgi:hypothetical protein